MAITAYHPGVSPRSFLASALVFAGLFLACRRDPPPPRALPTGNWWTKGAALRIDPKHVELTRRLPDEKAPLIVEGPHKSAMEPDGTFSLTVTVETLKRELLTKRVKDQATDILEPLETASFDGETITKHGVVKLTLKFSENDRKVEMCFTQTKKCTRLEHD